MKISLEFDSNAELQDFVDMFKSANKPEPTENRSQNSFVQSSYYHDIGKKVALGAKYGMPAEQLINKAFSNAPDEHKPIWCTDCNMAFVGPVVPEHDCIYASPEYEIDEYKAEGEEINIAELRKDFEQKISELPERCTKPIPQELLDKKEEQEAIAAPKLPVKYQYLEQRVNRMVKYNTTCTLTELLKSEHEDIGFAERIPLNAWLKAHPNLITLNTKPLKYQPVEKKTG